MLPLCSLGISTAYCNYHDEPGPCISSAFHPFLSAGAAVGANATRLGNGERTGLVGWVVPHSAGRVRLGTRCKQGNGVSAKSSRRRGPPMAARKETPGDKAGCSIKSPQDIQGLSLTFHWEVSELKFFFLMNNSSGANQSKKKKKTLSKNIYIWFGTQDGGDDGDMF